MRIAILIDEYVSGAQPVLAKQEARFLRDEGFDVDILVGTKFLKKADYPQDGSFRFLTDRYPRLIRKLNFRFPFFSFFSPQHLASILFAPRVVREKEYDLIIAHGLFSGLIAFSIKKARKIPFFTVFWDPSSCILPKVYSKTPLRFLFFMLIPLTELVDKFVATHSDRLLLGSKFYLDWFTERKVKNIKVVYPGCSPVEELPEKREDFILAVDRWDIGSSPEIILDALCKSKLKLKLKVVGHWHDEPLKKKFLKKVSDSGLSELVEITGPVTFEELRKLYLSARCFVHPTLEAFGMAAFEAASFGCPFIIPRRSGVTDLFTHSKDGFFPIDGNLKEYSSYLVQLIENKSLAYTMGCSAWETTRKHSWKRHAQEITGIIKDFFNLR
jgi:glycosyltransferase involved in cell wall biosynthesis